MNGPASVIYAVVRVPRKGQQGREYKFVEAISSPNYLQNAMPIERLAISSASRLLNAWPYLVRSPSWFRYERGTRKKAGGGWRHEAVAVGVLEGKTGGRGGIVAA